MNSKKQIALIYGGKGCERSVSISGAKNILPLIDGKRYGVHTVLIEKNGKMRLATPDGDTGKELFPIMKNGKGAFATEDGETLEIDAAFPLLHGDFGEDGTVQGLLSSLGIAFVGSDTRASAICLDKAITKAAAESLGIPTVPWHLITDGDIASEPELPLFIKPDCLGSSFGASPARSIRELRAAVADANRIGNGRVIAERLISPLRELECAYFSAQGEEILTPPGEIICDGFYSYDKKYSADSARTVAKADIPGAVSDGIREYARELCKFIGIRHLARVDFFLSGSKIYFNEINTMPGMTKKSLYLGLLENVGISPAEAINRMISDAVSEAMR